MTIKEVLDKSTNFFRDKGFESARLDAELLLSNALGIERMRLYLDFDKPLNDVDLAKCREAVRRRSTGEPVAYIMGQKGFFGLNFVVNSNVLIPRPETEHVVEEALNWAQKNQLETPDLLDLGAGSGCIGVSLLKHLPSAQLIAIDLSPGAVAVAEENAQKNEVNERARFFVGSATSPEDRAKITDQHEVMFDVIVANPPYIAPNDSRTETNVKKYEPNTALFSEDNGLADLKSWSTLWFGSLRKPGIMLMEMGLDQGAEMKKHFQNLGFSDVSIVRDLSGKERIIKGVHHG